MESLHQCQSHNYLFAYFHMQLVLPKSVQNKSWKHSEVRSMFALNNGSLHHNDVMWFFFFCRAKKEALLSETQAERICIRYLFGEFWQLLLLAAQEGKTAGFTLPLFLFLPCSHDGQVRHYHIKQDDVLKYFISEKHRFPSIKELIEYHKLNGGGLVTRLRRPPAQLAPNLATLSPLFGKPSSNCVCSWSAKWPTEAQAQLAHRDTSSLRPSPACSLRP